MAYIQVMRIFFLSIKNSYDDVDDDVEVDDDDDDNNFECLWSMMRVSERERERENDTCITQNTHHIHREKKM